MQKNPKELQKQTTLCNGMKELQSRDTLTDRVVSGSQ